MYFTPEKAKKIIAALLFVSVTAQAVKDIIWFQADVYTSITVIHIYLLLLNVVVPFSVLVVNVAVVREVRRASNTAASAAHLGRAGQHHQPTSSNSALPSITLLTASLIYLGLCSTWFILYYVYWLTQYSQLSSTTKIGLKKVYLVAEEAHSFVFSCIFYVYLVRRKQFRSDLYELFCRCRDAAAAGVVSRHRIDVDTRV